MSVHPNDMYEWCETHGVREFSEHMRCCNECGQWDCQPYTLDTDYEEVCDVCYPAFKAKEDEALAEQQSDARLERYAERAMNGERQ